MDILYGPDYFIRDETVIAIGKFDGLHDGHRKIIDILCKEAKINNLKSVVYTFLVNPKIVLKHDHFTPLMTNEEKSCKLEKLNIDYLIYEDFNVDFSNMLPEEFVSKILVDKLNVKEVVMGENSTFGKMGSGDIYVMRRLGKKYNFKVKVVELVRKDGKVISSTLLRKS